MNMNNDATAPLANNPADANPTAEEEDVKMEDANNNQDPNGNTTSMSTSDDQAQPATSSDDDEDDDYNEAVTTAEGATDLITKALTLKEEGNAHFKSGELDRAGRSYRRGASTLKTLNENNTGDEQVKVLLLSLQTNLSLVCLKQGKAAMSRDVATKALEIDEKNIKALFRRAVAYRSLGNLDKANKDLRKALKLNPDNREVKRELISIKKQVEADKAKEKASMSGFLTKKSGDSFGLYSDKAEEETRKAKEKAEKEKAKEEALKKRKLQWEDECVARMSRDEPAITYEEWDKQESEKQKKEDEEKKKLQKKLRQEEEEKRRREREERRKKEKKEESDDSDDEAALQELRGYKKTSDGRTTSYFTREIAAEEKALIGDITPKMINANDCAPKPINDKCPISRSSSAWNTAGTWEEKDVSSWARGAFKNRLSESSAVYAEFAAVVTKVDSISGDASVAVVSSKKRYIFDFSTKIEFDVTDDTDEKVASGELKLIDIHSASTDDDSYDIEFKWTKTPNVANIDQVDACRKLFTESVCESVKKFIQ
eukprot:CAMPEP_0196809880 /NCGR_PEP_ID=MMETSP1362-20130617/9751_1 /TAXON_ID=163516 /ORGANISM="Leptocylindrus danicus, Strain CCMP1856" /LENGTH=542 /DNA_ID=CAMNT_0042184699 /DNA_START=11 /DNA_END=1636 /DNA_ORIENTATION=+